MLSLADQNVNIALTFSSSHKAMECYNKENRAASNNAIKFTYYNMLHCVTVTMTMTNLNWLFSFLCHSGIQDSK